MLSVTSTKSKNFTLSKKIYFHLFFRILSILIVINIVIFLLASYSTLLGAEKESLLFMESYSKAESNFSREIILEEFEKQHPYFTISFEGYQGNGSKILNALHTYTPLGHYNASRGLIPFSEGSLANKVANLQLFVDFPDENIHIVYDISKDLADKKHLIYILLILETILLISGTLKSRNKVQDILRPLSDMAQQAQSLNAISGRNISAEEMKHLRSLAGTISSIDATKLDKRLPEDAPQKELQDLATAINSMLDRIDEAYHSQVRFVSDASHELRTPIAVLQGYINLLDRWGKNDEATTQEAIDALKSEADSMKDLVEQLLFLARGDNETLQIYLESFDLSQLVEETFKETNMIDKTHVFTSNIQDSIYFNGDPHLIKQALRILMDNSIKYTPENGEILVSVSREAEKVKISIQDNGIGIEAESLPYIFDRFYRSDESRARKSGGSGLGLSIMKWVIDRHGGTIEVISRKDIGTRTTIFLP